MSFEQLKESHIWNILKNYLDDVGIVAHQIKSFNYFINSGLQKVIDNESDIEITPRKGQKYKAKFGKVYVGSPYIIEENRKLKRVFPNEIRERDLHYEANVMCDIEETYTENDESKVVNHSRVTIATIPIMLGCDICNLKKLTKIERIRSGECKNDPGGYFIIKGNERVLVSQLRGVYNKIIVLKQKPSDKKYSYIAEMRSMSDETGHSVSIKSHLHKNGRNVTFSIPYIKEPINIGIVFKALGFTKDDDIINLIGIKNLPNCKQYMNFILRDSYITQTQEEALNYIGKLSLHIIPQEKRGSYARQVVETELFPHLGVTATIKEKAVLMGEMVKKMFMTKLGIRTVDDRDNYVNKRVETAGMLCGDLFTTLYKKYINSIKQKLESKKNRIDVLSIIFRLNIITSGLRHSFATGNWGAQKSNYIRTGVSQVLNRMTYGATLSHLRRIVIPVGKEGKNAKIRQIHSSQIFMICPAECFDPETSIMMWNGSVKRAGDIIVGDVLIDDFGEPVKVKTTCSGKKNMYDIIPTKKNFTNHRVTDNHILTLKIRKHKDISKTSKDRPKKWFIEFLNRETLKIQTKHFKTQEEAVEYAGNMGDDNTIDLTIEKYEKLSKRVKERLVIFKNPGFNWPKQEVLLDPYILGMWLGDGFTLNYKNDAVIKKYNLVENKHIPKEYIVNDRETRLKLLAGLIDTCGSVRAQGIEIRICQESVNTKIIENAHTLATSLGFSCGVKDISQLTDGKSYTELTITGTGIENIPTLLPRKKINHSCESFMGSKFKLVETGIGEYVGWQLEDKRGRFTLAGGEIVHNTPEGLTGGIVLNFSLLTGVTLKIPTQLIRKVIGSHIKFKKMEDVALDELDDYTIVYLNGIIIGLTDDPDVVIEKIDELKNKHILHYDVSASYNAVDECISIYCDNGRLKRPLFNLDKEGQLKIKETDGIEWVKLVRNNLITYLDNSEIEQSVLAMDQKVLREYKNDYCEIHPAMMLGVMASIIPFPDHNQSPRNCYQSSMGKQALGMYALSYQRRTDTISHVLDYPQKPLVSTKPSRFLGFSKLPSGINVIVAISTYTGYGQEDSIMMNQSSIDRGLFVVTSFRTLTIQEKKGGSYSSEVICLPPKNCLKTSEGKELKDTDPKFFKRKTGNYSLLGKDGVVRLGLPVKEKDIIVGKISITCDKSGNEKKMDISIAIKSGEEGTVHKIVTSVSPNGYKLVKIIIRKR